MAILYVYFCTHFIFSRSSRLISVHYLSNIAILPVKLQLSTQYAFDSTLRPEDNRANAFGLLSAAA